MPFNEGLKDAIQMKGMVEDENGIFWIGSDKGFYRFNGHSALNMNNHFNSIQANIITGTVYSDLKIDKNENLWVGSYHGLFHIDLEKMICEKIFLDEPKFQINYRDKMDHLLLQGDSLWVETHHGLYIVNINTKKVIDNFFTDGEATNKRQTTTGIYSVYPNISIDSFWVVLVEGIFRVNKKDKSYDIFYVEMPYKEHLFYQGIKYGNQLLMPSYGRGMVEFNLETQASKMILIEKNKPFAWPDNIIRCAIPLNDSLSMVSAENNGTGFYNRHTKEFKWLPVHWFLKEGMHHIYIDRHGFAWSGRRGHLFRSNRPVKKNNKVSNSIIDVTSLFANGKKKSVPCFDGYQNIALKEEERNIELFFSLTQKYLYDSVKYEYQLNNEHWKKIANPHQLSIFNFSGGKNKLKIRAKTDEKIIAARTMSFDVFIPFYKTSWFYLISVIALLGIGLGVARFRIAQVRKEEQLRAGFERKLAEIESMALRSQINPHFIFNTLNSIKYYAVAKPPEETGDFINHFSTLIRQILENSKKNLIPLREEIATLSNYIEIEKLRFRNAFESKIEIDLAIDQDFFMIPPSLIQPFVENSIWHGLMHKEGDKKLDIIFTQIDETIFCQITDNGIGRIASTQIRKSNTHKSSLGMSITKDRIEHLYAVHGIKSEFEIIDLYDKNGKAEGTKVVISFKSL